MSQALNGGWNGAKLKLKREGHTYPSIIRVICGLLLLLPWDDTMFQNAFDTWSLYELLLYQLLLISISTQENMVVHPNPTYWCHHMPFSSMFHDFPWFSPINRGLFVGLVRENHRTGASSRSRCLMFFSICRSALAQLRKAQVTAKSNGRSRMPMASRASGSSRSLCAWTWEDVRRKLPKSWSGRHHKTS